MTHTCNGTKTSNGFQNIPLLNVQMEFLTRSSATASIRREVSDTWELSKHALWFNIKSKPKLKTNKKRKGIV